MNLPPELIEQILLYLNLTEIVICYKTHYIFRVFSEKRILNIVNEKYVNNPLKSTIYYEDLRHLIKHLSDKGKMWVIDILNNSFARFKTYFEYNCSHKATNCPECHSLICSTCSDIGSRRKCKLCKKTYCGSSSKCLSKITYSPCCQDTICNECILTNTCTYCNNFICNKNWCRGDNKVVSCQRCNNVPMCNNCAKQHSTQKCDGTSLVLCNECEDEISLKIVPCDRCYVDLFCIYDKLNEMDAMNVLLCNCTGCGQKHFCKECMKSLSIETCYKTNTLTRIAECNDCARTLDLIRCKDCGKSVYCNCTNSCSRCRTCFRDFGEIDVVQLQKRPKGEGRRNKAKKFWDSIVGDKRSLLD